jgi:hypothetical protein
MREVKGQLGFGWRRPGYAAQRPGIQLPAGENHTLGTEWRSIALHCKIALIQLVCWNALFGDGLV